MIIFSAQLVIYTLIFTDCIFDKQRFESQIDESYYAKKKSINYLRVISSVNLFETVTISIPDRKYKNMNSLLTCISDAARAHIFVQRFEIACSTVEAGRGVAGVLDRDFAQAGGKTDRT